MRLWKQLPFLFPGRAAAALQPSRVLMTVDVSTWIISFQILSTRSFFCSRRLSFLLQQRFPAGSCWRGAVVIFFTSFFNRPYHDFVPFWGWEVLLVGFWRFRKLDSGGPVCKVRNYTVKLPGNLCCCLLLTSPSTLVQSREAQTASAYVVLGPAKLSRWHLPPCCGA